MARRQHEPDEPGDREDPSAAGLDHCREHERSAGGYEEYLEDGIRCDCIIDVCEPVHAYVHEQSDEPCLIYRMVVGIITVKHLLYLVQAVRTDLSRIRAEIENSKIDSRKEHEEYCKPDPGLAGSIIFSEFYL